MRYILIMVAVLACFYSCNTSSSSMNASSKAVTVNDTIRIANDSLEYEIFIIEPGFNTWILTQPPKGYYGIPFLESRNRNYVYEYNNRVLNPQRYTVALYPQQINYEMGIHYGLEVNYMLYNYFLYFQKKYKQNFISGRN